VWALFVVRATVTLSHPDDEAVKFTVPDSAAPPRVRSRTDPFAAASAFT
jgi:hypothetical protein